MERKERQKGGSTPGGEHGQCGQAGGMRGHGCSDGRAGPGSKARAWAQLFRAWASKSSGPAHFQGLGSLGLARLKPGLLE